jgi:transcriptional regulator with XRE-family HTH domain
MTRQGVTQAELARRLEIKPPSLSQILNGKYGTIPESLLDLLGALGLTLEVVPIDSIEPVTAPAQAKPGRKPIKGKTAKGEM